MKNYWIKNTKFTIIDRFGIKWKFNLNDGFLEIFRSDGLHGQVIITMKFNMLKKSIEYIILIKNSNKPMRMLDLVREINLIDQKINLKKFGY